MDVKYINPFIIGALDIFEEVANIELKKSTIELKLSTTPSNDIAIVIGVSGYIEGQVVYSLKPHTAGRIVNCMMPGATPQKQQEYFYSALCSLANMITGRATILLAGAEHIIRITPPVVVLNKKGEIKFIEHRTINIQFTSRFGTIEMNIAIHENPNYAKSETIYGKHTTM